MSFYKMERGWLDSPMFRDAAYEDRSAWAWMIGEARWEDGVTSIQGVPMPIKRGQFYASVRFMAKKFQWSTNRVLRFLERLKKWGSIVAETETGQTIITICNYGQYQDGRDTNGDTSGNSTGDTPGDTSGDKLKEIQEIQEGEEEIAGKIPASKPSRKKSVKQTLESYLTTAHGMTSIPQEWGEWSYATGRMTVEEINAEWETMRDWAQSKGEKKSDWEATWRNWCRRFIKQKTEQERRDELFAKKRTGIR